MADRRWRDPDENEWASEFEYRTYDALRVLGYDVRKCGEGDSFSYTTKVRGGHCMECGSGEVRQRRTYTPDLYVSDIQNPDGTTGAYIEAKGYWPAPKRNLLRRVAKSNPDLVLLFVFQVDRPIARRSGTKYSDYVRRYFPGRRSVVYNWSRAIKRQETLDRKLQEFKNEFETLQSTALSGA